MLKYWIDINKLNWIKLLSNPNAQSILEQNLDKVNWYYLSVLNRICFTNSIMNDCGHRIYFALQNIYMLHQPI